LLNLPNDQHALGVFSQGDMPVWLDRNVFTDSLEGRANSPLGTSDSASDLPGLKDMTLKAIEILHQRSRFRKTTAEDDEKTQADDVWDNRGFFLMSEAASIDKQMHEMDYDRALGDLLELDDTLRATVKKLEELEILNETLLLVTADHGHGFE
jgi:alkaline phosphatase